MTEAYPVGATVRYRRPGVVGADGGPATAAGFINGVPYRDEDGVPEWVPVWTERMRGREGATMFVHVSNIIEVEGTQP